MKTTTHYCKRYSKQPKGDIPLNEIKYKIIGCPKIFKHLFVNWVEKYTDA